MASGKPKNKAAAGPARGGKQSGTQKGGKAAAKPVRKYSSGARPAQKWAPAPPTATEGMTTLQRVAWIALHVLVFAVPVAMSNANWLARPPFGMDFFALPLTYDQFDIVKVFVMRACALVGLAAWTFEFLMHGGRLRRTKVDWLVLAFLAWVLVTSFTSISPATAIFGKYRRFEGFISFLTYAIVFFLTVQLADRPIRIRSLAHTFVVSGTIVAGYGVLQFLGLDPVSWGAKLPFEANRAFSTFGNPDLLGGFLVLLLPLTLAMALSDKRLVWRAVYWVLFLIAVAAWIVAFVRGAWIGGSLAIALVIAGAILAKVSWGWVDWSATGGTALVGGGIIAWSLTNANPVLNFWSRLVSIFEFKGGSAGTRFEIWSAALQAIKERPIAGFGADTFRLVFPHTKPLVYVRDAGYLSVADNVHNYPLQIAAGIGLVGFALLYGLFGWVLVLGAPNAFSRGKGSDRLIITGFWAAALGYIIHLMFGLSVTGSSVFLWFSLAMVLAPLATTADVSPKAWGPAVGVLLAVVLTAASVYNVAYIVADNYYLKAQFGGQAGENTIETIQTAIRLNPYNDMYRSQLGQTYTDQMMAWINQARQVQAKGQDPGADVDRARKSFLLAEQAYLDTMDFVPTEYDNYVFLTALYNQAGQYFGTKYFEEAVATGRRGTVVEPFGPAVRVQTALGLLNLGRDAEAAKLLEETAVMDPGYFEPRLLLGDTYGRMGRRDKAREQYRMVLEIQPANAQALGGLKALDATAAGPSQEATSK